MNEEKKDLPSVIPIPAFQPIAEAEPSENPDQLELNEEEYYKMHLACMKDHSNDDNFYTTLKNKGYKIIKQG